MKTEYKVNIKELLSFFDEKPKESKKQATSLVALFGEELCTSILEHYFVNQRNSSTEILFDKDGDPITVNKGTNKGKRLDRWMFVAHKNGVEELFQIEVKNWSSHSTDGSKTLSQMGNDLEKFASDNWNRHIIDKTGSAIVQKNKDKIEKVFIRMIPPDKYNKYKNKIKPLLCLWFYVMHPQTKETPFFEYKIKIEDFDSVYIFSTSAYLRKLYNEGKTQINLDMPLTAKKLEWLHKIFGKSLHENI